jgi:hypothetical protein
MLRAAPLAFGWVVLGQILGCANTVDESMNTRIRLGDAERIVSPSDYQIQLREYGSSDTKGSEQILGEPVVEIQATKTTTLTTRTPRTEEDFQSILPYSPFREMLEFLTTPMYLLWAIPTWNWDQWFAMANPALNSESMWKGSHVEQVTDSRAADPLVEVKKQTDRIATPIDVQLDDLTPVRVLIVGDGEGTQVDVVDLLTAPVFVAPTTLLASMTIEGRSETSTSTLGIQPALGGRLLHARRYLLDPSSGRHSPAELGGAVLRLSELGFRRRSSSLRSSASLIFGTQTMDRAIASEYIDIASNQKREEHWPAALENIGAARALDKRANEGWDHLEADVFEKQALGFLGAGDYDLARSGLLRATTIDSTRQQRLAPFVTMSIEASDRATDRHAAQKSRDAFLAIERERADAEAAVARSNAARLAPRGAAIGGAPTAARRD